MLCGTTEALLTGCEANTHDVERFAYIREENFSQTHQAWTPVHLWKILSPLKHIQSSYTDFFKIRFFLKPTKLWWGPYSKIQSSWYRGIEVRFELGLCPQWHFFCKNQPRICILSSCPFIIPLPFSTQWGLSRKILERGSRWQKLKSALCILPRN